MTLKLFPILPLIVVSFAASFTSIKAQEKQRPPIKQHELATSLDKVVTGAMASEISGFPEAGLIKNYTPSEKRPQTDVVTYSWNNGRKKKVGNFESPMPDTVKFGWLRISSRSSLEAKESDPVFKDILERVEGLGELSLWNKRDGQLIVLQKGAEFSVWVDVSPDPAQNKAKSIALAKKIVDGPLK
jgi:hypothetical protein